ncbi:MAG: membrane protein insertase YidC [Negativicutes bacterium]|nr:membrane protein insertase YidC [Negativicutes bacterium]MBP8629131.1 membrane protein insertase YidC [Negativicutes bacterium]MBP9537320.1 membrane protein insertase YidC [Negativicutes bacterium]MBP9949316.1 membrane protein insertase YidC [Negativicutes bacterium]
MELSFLFDSFIAFLQAILTVFYNISGYIGFANYGVAIILMTIVIKILLYPLTVKQIKSMKAMQDLQPKMKELQEKFKDKPEKLQQEMAALYKNSGVNPLAGCLPLLAQMPILMGIFFAIRDYSYIGDPTFFWLSNLSVADHIYVLPILSAVTTYIQQKQTMNDDNPQTKMMMYFMPIFIGYISINFPSGLVLYWVVSNIAQIIQQWWMYRDEAKVKEGAV